MVKLRHRGWFTPWTQDKGEGQTIIMRVWEPLPVPLPTDQSSQDEQPEKAWEAVSKGRFGGRPPSYSGRKAAFSSCTSPKALVTWYLPPSFPQWKDNLGCPGNFRWWLCPSTKSHAPFWPLQFPALQLLSSTADDTHLSSTVGSLRRALGHLQLLLPLLPRWGKGTWARAALRMIVHSGPQSSYQPSSLIYSSDHAIPLWNVLILSPPQVPKPNFFLTSRERSKSTSPLLPNYSLRQFHYAGLWHNHLVLSTTCFLPITWKKFHLQISSAVSPFSPLHHAVPKSRLSKSLVSSSSQTFPK